MNKLWKVLLPLMLVMVLLTASLPAFADELSPTTKAIGLVKASTTTYNGMVQFPTLKVYDTTGELISPEYYRVKVPGLPKNAGTYKITVTATAPYIGTKTAKFVIRKAYNPFTIKVGKSTFKRNVHRNQTTSIRVSGVKGNAKLGHWFSTSRNVYVKGGKVIVKKGIYGTAILSIKTRSTMNYKATKKNIAITIVK